MSACPDAHPIRHRPYTGLALVACAVAWLYSGALKMVQVLFCIVQSDNRLDALQFISARASPPAQIWVRDTPPRVAMHSALFRFLAN